MLCLKDLKDKVVKIFKFLAASFQQFFEVIIIHFANFQINLHILKWNLSKVCRLIGNS